MSIEYWLAMRWPGRSTWEPKPEQDWVQCVTCDLVWDDLNPDRESCECRPSWVLPLPGPPVREEQGLDEA